MKYFKNEIDFEQCRCKEIEVFQYKGNLEKDNVPEWVTNALINDQLRYDSNRMLFIPYYNLDVHINDYIILKLPTRGYGDIAVCDEAFLNRYYNKCE